LAEIFDSSKEDVNDKDASGEKATEGEQAASPNVVQVLQPTGSILQDFKHPKGSLPIWSKLSFSKVFSGVACHAPY